MMTYPGETVAPSVITEFINGIKFDICEVDKGAYNMLYNKTARYFVCVEDNHIVYYKSAEEYFDKTGECRWDLFCRTKQECKDLINEFSVAHDSIERQLERAEKPAFTLMAMQSVNKIRERMMNIFGTYPL